MGNLLRDRGAISDASTPVRASLSLSLVVHGAVATALLSLDLIPAVPDHGPMVVEIAMLSEAPMPGVATTSEGPADASPAVPGPPPDDGAVLEDFTPEAGVEIAEPDPASDPAPEALIRNRPRPKPRPPGDPAPRSRVAAPKAGPPTARRDPPADGASAPTRAATGTAAASGPVDPPSAAAANGGPRGRTRRAASFRLGSADNPKPRYPRLARLRGWEGRVVLSVEVDANGRVSGVAIETSSGFPILDAAARRAVGAWRFQPARTAGVPVAGRVRVPIRFELTEG